MKKILLIIIFLLFTNIANANIALDTNTSAYQADSNSSWTWAYTTTGTNRFLIMGCLGGSNLDNITGITYNGVSMTLSNSAGIPSGGRWTYLFTLMNPASGANNVVVSKSGADLYSECYAVSYTGVAQTGQPEVANKGTVAAGSSISVAVTTLTTGAWIAGYMGLNTANTLFCNKTLRYTAGNEFTCDSNAAVSVGSNTLTGTPDISANMAMEVIGFAPAVDTPAINRQDIIWDN